MNTNSFCFDNDGYKCLDKTVFLILKSKFLNPNLVYPFVPDTVLVLS